jgi:hypothetical protein
VVPPFTDTQPRCGLLSSQIVTRLPETMATPRADHGWTPAFAVRTTRQVRPASALP